MKRFPQLLLKRVLVLLGALSAVSVLQAKPIKVYILAGQSNMQGHANVSTFDYIGKDPKTAPILKQMVDDDGKPVVLDDVWITYVSETRSGETIKSGKLTAGFGAGDDKIGPEFTFGIHMGKVVDEPILIIKTAWGGKSIHTDFRPPSAGPRKLNESERANLTKKGEDIDAAEAKLAEQSGHYYRLMMDYVNTVLADPGKYCEEYNAKDGYEIAGFVWFQGWNDMVASNIYPDRGKPGGYDLYSELMGTFIDDVRKDLKTPELPFVIGVLGVGGPVDHDNPNRYTPIHQGFRDAMAAPASLPKYKGNVTAVLTEECWDPLQTEASELKGKVNNEIKEMQKEGKKLSHEERLKLFDELIAKHGSEKHLEALKGISNQGFHYLGSGKVLGCIGMKFAKAMEELEK